MGLIFIAYSDIPSRMKGAGTTRTVAIAFQTEGILQNPLGFRSEGLKPILMYCCGPRTGNKACASGARTVHPDSHVAAGWNNLEL